MRPEQIAAIVSEFPCFAAVTPDEWRHSEAFIARLPAQPVIGEGHLFKHASFVLKGCVRIYKISSAGKELTLYRVRSGETCVIMMASILGETGYEANAETEEDTELLVLPAELFKLWMHTYKELNPFIYRLFIQRMVSVTGLVEEMTFHSMDRRVAEWLLRQPGGQSEAPLYRTHESLAIELGTAREVVSRILKRFEKRGWIRLGRGKLYVLQRGELERLLQVK